MKAKIPSAHELLLIFMKKKLIRCDMKNKLIKCENQVHMNYY
jgi:hypothetical protein